MDHASTNSPVKSYITATNQGQRQGKDVGATPKIISGGVVLLITLKFFKLFLKNVTIPALTNCGETDEKYKKDLLFNVLFSFSCTNKPRFGIGPECAKKTSCDLLGIPLKPKIYHHADYRCFCPHPASDKKNEKQNQGPSSSPVDIFIRYRS